MPDRDWERYKPLRGSNLPSLARFLGRDWKLDKVLKRDFYAITGVYNVVSTGGDDPADTRGGSGSSIGPRTEGRVLVKVYHTDRLGPLPLAWLGRMLCLRESRLLQALAGIEGVPRFLGFFGTSGLVREFVPGANLREHGKYRGLRDDFFPRLRAIVLQMHERGIAHNDLSKPENVLVDDRGNPVLIDFQIALGMLGNPRSPRMMIRRPFVHALQRSDLYHVRKLHRRFRPFDFSPEELSQAKRKSVVVHIHGFFRRPYRKVRHYVLNRYMKVGSGGQKDA